MIYEKVSHLGTNEFAEIAFNYFSDEDYKIECFVVDAKFKDKDLLLGTIVVTTDEFLDSYSIKDASFF